MLLVLMGGMKGLVGVLVWAGSTNLKWITPFSNPKSSSISLLIFHKANGQGPIQSPVLHQIPVHTGIAKIWVTLGGNHSRGDGGVEVKRQVSGAMLATVTSEVVHPGGKKAAGARHGRGEVAKAGRRPLHDELGGHWQQVPGQTDTSEGWRD